MDETATRPAPTSRPRLRRLLAVSLLGGFGALVACAVIYSSGNAGISQAAAKAAIKRLNGRSWEKEPTQFIRELKRKLNDWRFKRTQNFLDGIFPTVLDHVRLEHGPIPTNDLAIICAVDTIRFLDIPGTLLSSDHWRIITTARNIEGFHVNGPAVHVASIPRLTNLTRLRHLSLESETVADEHLTVLRSLPSLTELSLNRARIKGTGLTNLHGLTQLTHIDIAHTPVTDDYLSNLSGLTRLDSLYVGEHITDAGIPHLLPLTNINTLGFMNSKVDNPGVDVVLKAFPKLKHLTLFYVEAYMDKINIDAYPHVTLEAAF